MWAGSTAPILRKDRYGNGVPKRGAGLPRQHISSDFALFHRTKNERLVGRLLPFFVVGLVLFPGLPGRKEVTTSGSRATRPSAVELASER
jgi:hypothetical protein